MNPPARKRARLREPGVGAAADGSCCHRSDAAAARWHREPGTRARREGHVARALHHQHGDARGGPGWPADSRDRQGAAGAGRRPSGRRRSSRWWRWRRTRRIEERTVDALDAVVGGGLRLQLTERIEVRPRRLLPAARRPAHDGHAVPDGDHPAARTQAHHDDLRGRHAHLARDLHGRPQVPRRRRDEPHLSGIFSRPVGRRHAGGREQGLQREQLVRLLRPSAHRSDVGGGAVDAAQQADASLRGDGDRPRRLHASLHDRLDHPVRRSRRAARGTSARRTTSI